MKYSLLSKYRTELMGAAMLWVMLFHAWDLDMGHPLLEWFRAAGFGGVDIFILLSAMGLAMSLDRREQDYSSFMARRAERILPAYYTVALPYTLFLILYQGVPWSALIWNTTLLYYWLRSAGAFNWYVAGAMTFYAVTPWCFRRLKRSGNRELLTGCAVAGAFLLYQLLIREGYWYVTDIAYRVPVFFLGLLMGLYVREDCRLGGKDLCFWAGWFLLGVVYLVLSRVEQDFWLFPLCPLFLFTTVPTCLGLGVVFEKLPLGWVRRGLRLVGENSLEIYLFNVSVFSQVDLWRRIISFGPTNRLYWLIMFGMNLGLGIGLHWLVERVRKRI